VDFWFSELVTRSDFIGRLRRLLRQLAHFVATTAKPRPCSPARAASIAAFNASRLVWSAISFTCWVMPAMARVLSTNSFTESAIWLTATCTL